MNTAPDTDALIQRGLDAGIGAEVVELWPQGAKEREDAEASLVDKLYSLTHRMDAFERALEANTAATQRIAASTETIVEVVESWRGAMRVLEWIGKAAKPLSYVATALAAIAGLVYSIKGGGKP